MIRHTLELGVFVESDGAAVAASRRSEAEKASSASKIKKGGKYSSLFIIF